MVVNFLDGFCSGAIRLCFDRFDAFWVGQTARGWNAKGGKLFGLEKVLWNGRVRFEIHDIKLADTGFNVSVIEFLDQVQVKLARLHVDGRVVSVKVNMQKDKV